MKKWFSFLFCSVLLTRYCDFSNTKVDAIDSINVNVSISNGELLLAQEPICVTDVDEDGVISLHDALFLAHEAKYQGGAQKGYAVSQTQFGLSLERLWGIENGGSYGYYCNNIASSNLADEIHSGDNIYAYAYTDLTTWSDTYTYFDNSIYNINVGDTLDFQLLSAGYDANWNPITVPLSGAILMIDKNETSVLTDESGNGRIHFDKPGQYILSAKCTDQVIVPPSARVSVSDVKTSNSKEESVRAGDKGVSLASMVLGISMIALIALRRKHANSKVQ